MLDTSLAGQLKSLLERLTVPIELVSSLDDGPKSAELAELLTEIAAMSDKISYSRADDDARRPSFVIRRSSRSSSPPEPARRQRCPRSIT